MHKIYFILFLVTVFTKNTQAQSLAINSDGSTANASALLDVKSTNKGLLIPRMSKTERNGIATPATGLLVFQNAPDSIGFYYYDGSKWNWMAAINGNADTLAWKTKGNTGINTISNFIGNTDNKSLRFRTDNIERMVLSENGDIGFGTTNVGTYLPTTKVEFASEGSKQDILHRYAGPNTPGYNFFTSNGTLASPTSVSASSFLGKINFYGHDGTNFLEAANIFCMVDGGTVATNTLGTRLTFETRGSNLGPPPFERMRINSDGNVGIATTTAETKLVINGGVSYMPYTIPSLPSGNFTYAVGNRSYIKVISGVTPGSLILGFSAGLEIGQLFILECSNLTTAGNGFQLVQGLSANMQFSETAGTVDTFDSNDIATFIWTGTAWLMISSRTN